MSTAMTAGMGHACATGVLSMLHHSWCCRNSLRPWIRAGAAGWSREAGMPLRCHTGTGQPAYLLWCSMGDGGCRQRRLSQHLGTGPHLAAAVQVATGCIIAWLAQRRPHIHYHRPACHARADSLAARHEGL